MHYVCVACLDGVHRFFLWWSDDSGDRVVVDDRGSIRTFSSEHAARTAQEVSPEQPAIYDFDAIEAWCKSDAESVDCPTLLGAWNLIADVPGDNHLFEAADERAGSIYNKLFWGCNWPSMTPPGEQYVPVWTDFEISTLKRLLLLGLAELRARF